MSKITKFEELQCWQEARQLVTYVFRLCERPTIANNYKLRDQLQSAALSVMNNIAEGFSRFHATEFIRFLNFSSSSCSEIKSMSYVLLDLNKIDERKLNEFHLKINNTCFLVLGLIKYLKNKRQPHNQTQSPES